MENRRRSDGVLSTLLVGHRIGCADPDSGGGRRGTDNRQRASKHQPLPDGSYGCMPKGLCRSRRDISPMNDHPIYADDETTWPHVLVSAFERAFPLLQIYEADRQRIDRLCEVDIAMRCNAPTAKGTDSRLELIAAADRELATQKLVGYHASRLDATEVRCILRTGLRPLSRALVDERINRQVSLRNLSKDIAERLRTKNAANDVDAGQRLGLVHFCFSRSLLQSESGMSRLLAYWGGEALYRCYETDETVGTVLRSIGKPAIVEAAVPVYAIKAFLSIGERLLNAFLWRRGVSAEHASEFEGYTHESVPGEDIMQVTTSDERRFHELTRCSTWRIPPS
jgi:hypothetical protein